MFEEGFRTKRYLCSAGKTTIGYGHNCDAEPAFHGQIIPQSITKEYAETLLEHDINQTIESLRHAWPRFLEFDQVRRDSFVNMAFQMGVKGFMGFELMRAACLARSWDTAYTQALKSKWAEQTPNRAKRVAWQIKHGRHYAIPI